MIGNLLGRIRFTCTLISALSVPSLSVAKYIEENDSVLDPIKFKITRCSHLQIYGQLNQAIMFANDGRDNNLFFVTNDNTTSRLGLIFNLEIDQDLHVLNTYEFGIRVNRSNRVNQIDQSGQTDIDIRKLEIGLDSKRFGQVSLGQGRTASDQTTKQDLSGTAIVAFADVAKIGGGLFFRTEAGSLNADSTNPTIDQSFDDINGFKRKNRLRYDTPNFYGFSIAASAAEDRRYDLAVRFKNNNAYFKSVAAIAYTHSSTPLPTGPGTDNFAACQGDAIDCHRNGSVDGSASILFKNGINFSFAGGMLKPQEQPRHTANYSYGKIGYIYDKFCLGETAMTVDYGKYNHFSGDHNIGHSYGAAIVQHIVSWNLYLYGGYHHFSLSTPQQFYHNISVANIGLFFKI